MSSKRLGHVAYAAYPIRCTLCSKLIVRGLQMARTPGGWAHTGCLLSAVRKLAVTTAQDGGHDHGH